MDPGPPNRPIHVLTLTPFYPSMRDDATGCFISEPLAWMGTHGTKNMIMGVQPFYRGRIRAHPGAPCAENLSYFAFPSGFGLPSSGAFLFARLLDPVRQKHRRDPIDLIHAHSALPCGHAAALLSRELNIPFLVTVHGLDAFYSNQVDGYAGRWCRRVSQMVYCAASRVICISEHVRDQVVAGAQAGCRTAVVYNGVDPVQAVRLVRQGEPLQDGLSGSGPNPCLDAGIFEKMVESCEKLIQIVWTYQATIHAVMDDLFNTLATTPDRRFRSCHGFEIHTAQTFIAAWQSKNGTAPQRICDGVAILPSQEMYAIGDFQLTCQSE